MNVTKSSAKRKKNETSQLQSAKKYKQTDVYQALQEIDKGISTRKTSELFNVPRSTLYIKQKNLGPIECSKGPSPYLTYEEEKVLVEWIFCCSDRGFPITKTMLLQYVQKMITDIEKETPVKNNKPGRSWWAGFRRRHPDLALRVAQTLNAGRAAAAEGHLRNWFSVVETHLEKKNFLKIDPSRIFDLNECFFLVPKRGQGLARRGSKSVYKVINGDDKEKCISHYECCWHSLTTTHNLLVRKATGKSWE